MVSPSYWEFSVAAGTGLNNISKTNDPRKSLECMYCEGIFDDKPWVEIKEWHNGSVKMNLSECKND